MLPVLQQGIAGLPTEAVLIFGAIAVILAIIAIRIAIKIAIRIALVVLVILGALWALGAFADIHIWIF